LHRVAACPICNGELDPTDLEAPSCKKCGAPIARGAPYRGGAAGENADIEEKRTTKRLVIIVGIIMALVVIVPGLVVVVVMVLTLVFRPRAVQRRR
jgi:hypothetical protein